MLTLLKVDESDGSIIVDNAGIFLIEEFAALQRKDDKYYLNAALKYIFLALDWRSPYADYVEAERHQLALKDSLLTEEQYQDLEFRQACRKYIEIQESSLTYRLLQSAKTMVQKFVIYFEETDPTATDPATGKPIYKVKDIMGEISQLSGVIDELDRLEFQFKKQVEAPKATRAGIKEGFDPTKMDSGFFGD